MKTFLLIAALTTASSAMAQELQPLPTVVLAQAEQPASPPPQGGGPLRGLDNGDMTPGEIQRLFDAYLVMEAQQALALTDQQYPQFLTRLKTLQDTRRRNQQERNQLMVQLQRLTNPRQPNRGDEAQLKERLTALQELESRNLVEMRKAYSALDEVLGKPIDNVHTSWPKSGLPGAPVQELVESYRDMAAGR